MVLLDGTTAAKKGDEEDDAANHYQQDRCVEERIAEEVQVVAVDALDDAAGDDQSQTRDQEDEVEGKKQVLDALHATFDHSHFAFFVAFRSVTVKCLTTIERTHLSKVFGLQIMKASFQVAFWPPKNTCTVDAL